MDEATDLVLVFVSQGMLGAEVARSKLESNNIPAILRYEPLGKALGITVDGLGKVEVWVRPQDATAAGALLAEEEAVDPSAEEERAASPDQDEEVRPG